MASRGVACRKLLHKNLPFFLRRLSSAPAPITAVSPLSYGGSKIHYQEEPVTFTPKPNVITTTIPPAQYYSHSGEQIINFDDTKRLFSTVSTPKLFKSWATLQMTSMEPLVDVGLWVLSSRLVETPVIKQVILGAIKHTFYDHFCTGEDLEEVGRTISSIWDSGLRSMLDYGAEHATDNESCDRNLNDFIQTAEYTKSLPPSSASFVVVKITAICPPSLLRRVSDLLRCEYKNTGYHLPWKRDCLPIFADSSPFYHTAQKPNPLTPEEEQNLQLSHERLIKICEKCMEYNIPLLIDAEDTALQPAIDYLTYSLALLYHKGDDGPLLFGTIQAYSKDSKERLVKAKKAADKIGVPMGFKLVRGAYMSSESQLAASLGAECPIQNSIQETHDSYNECASFLLEEVARGSGAAVLATHNIESGKLAAIKATDLGIDKNSEKLQFAQLYGMADTLSFGLRNAGFQVSKYLPFGPVEQIMPYLLRRAEENRGLLSSSFLDRQQMRKELARRLKFPSP